MKVLGIARNIFVIFSGGNKQHWNEDLQGGVCQWATTQQAAPPSGAVRYVVGPMWLRCA